jgi:hypothetical protein
VPEIPNCRSENPNLSRIPESDVDLLVEHSTGNLEQIVELQRRLSARIGRPIHIVSLDDAHHSPLLLTDVLREGRVIVDRSDAWTQLQGERRRLQRQAAVEEEAVRAGAQRAVADARARLGT